MQNFFFLRFLDRHLDDRRVAVVRNGYQRKRNLQTEIKPSVGQGSQRSRHGKLVTLHSALVPPYFRKSQSLDAVLPWLYLKGISTGEKSKALVFLVDPDVKGLSTSTVAWQKQQWPEKYKGQCLRPLDKTIKHRMKRSKSCLSSTSMLYMMFKLGQFAQKCWRQSKGFDHLAKVIEGLKFKDSIVIENADQVAT